MNEKQRTFLLTSIFLQYPNEGWIKDNILRNEVSKIKSGHIKKAFLDFLDYIDHTDVTVLCNQYVETFDFNDKTTLYLTYSEIGDEKERGNKLTELKELYEEGGCLLNEESNELPDYFPLILEFMSIAPKRIYEPFIQKVYKPILDLGIELEKSKSPYTLIVNACIEKIRESTELQQSGGAS